MRKSNNFFPKVRQFLLFEKQSHKLLHGLATAIYGTAEHNLSKTVELALERMAEEYKVELKHFDELDRMRHRRGDSERTSIDSSK